MTPGGRLPVAHRAGVESHRRSVTVEPIPIAAHAPAGAKPGHEGVPSTGLHAQGHVIADGATISIWKDEEEHDRCHDDAQHEERDEDDGKDHGRHIQFRLFDNC